MAQPTNDGNIVKRTSQYLDNLEHDDVTGAKGVSVYSSPDGVNVYRLKVNSDGSINSSSVPAKATDAYGIQAISDDGTYKYFFFEADNADYYILRKTIATSVFKYTKGTGGYAAVYQSAALGPSGSPTWADKGTTF